MEGDYDSQSLADSFADTGMDDGIAWNYKTGQWEQIPDFSDPQNMIRLGDYSDPSTARIQYTTPEEGRENFRRAHPEEYARNEEINRQTAEYLRTAPRNPDGTIQTPLDRQILDTQAKLDATTRRIAELDGQILDPLKPSTWFQGQPGGAKISDLTSPIKWAAILLGVFILYKVLK